MTAQDSMPPVTTDEAQGGCRLGTALGSTNPSITKRLPNGQIAPGNSPDHNVCVKGGKASIAVMGKDELMRRAMNALPSLLEAAKTPKAKAARLAGLRRSEKAKRAARMVGKKYWPANWEKLKQLPKFQATTEHIRALEWSVESPTGERYTFVNLAHFIRNHQDLFESDDLIWKRAGNGIKCRAYNGLSGLRPTLKKPLESWKGWVWSNEKGQQ